MVNISFDQLTYTFTKKPLLIGGMAMEYYDLRKAGDDIDLVVPEYDVVELIKRFPDRVKDLFGDLGVCPFSFERWRTICFFDYDDLREDAIEEEQFLVISLEKLLLLKALAMSKEKYLKDTYLLSEKINKEQGKRYHEIKQHIRTLTQNIPNISYIEKLGD